MKIVCVDNDIMLETYRRGIYLTVGKTYDVIEKEDNLYHIINDINNEDWYGQFRFKLLSEYRNDKIDKLLGI
jgi:hypothetical protein